MPPQKTMEHSQMQLQLWDLPLRSTHAVGAGCRCCLSSGKICRPVFDTISPCWNCLMDDLPCSSSNPSWSSQSAIDRPRSMQVTEFYDAQLPPIQNTVIEVQSPSNSSPLYPQIRTPTGSVDGDLYDALTECQESDAGTSTTS
ncbi:hypothetical protein BT69DRAFT_617712 [Atractiella rhizophila]|nr:hypothetical protein BT69DRAFT_617712 [Atractiella rhizophila]